MIQYKHGFVVFLVLFAGAFHPEMWLSFTLLCGGGGGGVEESFVNDLLTSW